MRFLRFLRFLRWARSLLVPSRHFEMVAEYPERGPEVPFEGGPRHLFVSVPDKGMCYVGLVASDQEATDRAHTVVGEVVMQTGKVTLSRYWTTEPHQLDEHERLAIQASWQAARGKP